MSVLTPAPADAPSPIARVAGAVRGAGGNGGGDDDDNAESVDWLGVDDTGGAWLAAATSSVSAQSQLRPPATHTRERWPASPAAAASSIEDGLSLSALADL